MSSTVTNNHLMYYQLLATTSTTVWSTTVTYSKIHIYSKSYLLYYLLYACIYLTLICLPYMYILRVRNNYFVYLFIFKKNVRTQESGAIPQWGKMWQELWICSIASFWLSRYDGGGPRKQLVDRRGNCCFNWAIF